MRSLCSFGGRAGRVLASAAVLVTVLGSSSLARADEAADTATRNAARELGSSGVEAYQAGRYEQASDELEKAYSILHVPSLGLWSARALVKRGRLVEAAARYRETIGLRLPSGDVEVHKKAVQDAKIELATLESAIPTLVIRVTGALPSEVEVTLDGEPLPSSSLDTPRRVNPGAHRLIGLRGAQRVTASETLSEGQHRQLELGFRTAAAAPLATPAPETRAPSPSTDTGTRSQRSHAQRMWSVVALATGGAGLAFGGVTGLLALGKRGQLDDTGKCTDGCPTSLKADVDKLSTYRTLSTVGFIAGGVLSAAGIVLWVTAPSEPQQVQARLSPGGILLDGTF